MSEVSVTFEPEKVSVEALAHLGEGHIAYVKQVRSEDVPGLFPQAPPSSARGDACRGSSPGFRGRGRGCP